MPNDKWNDEEIENLLRDFPKIQDNRPKAEVYKRVSQTQYVPKQPKRWLPLLVAIIAFLSITVLAVSLLQQNGNDSSSSETESDDAESMMTADEAQTEQTEQSIDEPEEAASMVIEEPEALRTAVYEQDLADAQILRIGLAQRGYVVPVSFIIPKQSVDETEPTSLELYEAFAEQIDESKLGFDEYHPYEGILQQDGAIISHFLPENHNYDQGSAATLLYLHSLEETFFGEEEIRVLNVSGEPAQLAHVGMVEPILPGVQGQSYYLIASSTEDWYLAPSYGLSEASVEDALIALQQAPNDDYRSPVPDGIEYDVDMNGTNALVTFEETLDLESLEGIEAMRLIESLALTAQSYDASLTIVNTVQSEWSGFDFSEELELPVSPNRMDWP
ncbi:hypothetical protein BBI11_10295 [Planococcus maritimus]|uniref:hypothetical protein n=1 Tax=Planococcus maritimus TaxID=192421 RepID=UPI00080F2DE9|nr:hypothetical protein [Planococcus maritimus]ANU17383.1 hypothetical protein BBI11_10295 [Planococcus maritimus]